jgi:hypothetical protein
MAREEQKKIIGPYGGEMTEQGHQARDAIVKRFSGRSEVTLQELNAFIQDELGVTNPILTLMYGGVSEIMLQALGMEYWMEETFQESRRFGKIPGVPRWMGYKRREG